MNDLNVIKNYDKTLKATPVKSEISFMVTNSLFIAVYPVYPTRSVKYVMAAVKRLQSKAL